MAETTPSPPLDDEPQPSAPRPGVRLRAPGAAPNLPEQPPVAPEAAPPAEGTRTPPPADQPTRPPAAGTPKARRLARAVLGDSETEPQPPSAAAGERATTTTSSTASTDHLSAGKPKQASPPAFVDPRELTDSLREMLLTGGEMANQRLAPDTPMFLADQAEAEGVARPVAKIVTRHMPAGLGGAGNPDLADAVAAIITLARYALRQIRLAGEIRRARAGADPLGTETEAA